MDNEVYAGIDIGGTKIAVSMAAKCGIRSRVRQSTRKYGGTDTIPKQVLSLLDDALGISGHQKDELSAVGISSAGPFGISGGMKQLISPNICGGLSDNEELFNDWKNVPLEEELIRELPELKLENDCISAAWAEHLFGAGVGFSNMIYVTWSTGIGTGAIVDGRLLHGKHGNAPHGGHIYMTEEGGPICGCGECGHLEAMLSGPALARAFGSKFPKELFEAYSRGDKEAKEIVENAARTMARGLVSMNAMLDTERFIFGGSVYNNNSEVLLPIMEETFQKSFSALTDGVSIVSAGLGEYLEVMAPLSLVIPDEWVAEWKEKRLWEQSPEVTVLD